MDYLSMRPIRLLSLLSPSCLPWLGLLAFRLRGAARPGLLAVLLVSPLLGHALTAEQAHALAAGENETRIEALAGALQRGDEGLDRFIQALLDDTVKVAGDRVFVMQGEQATEAAGGAPAALPDGAEDVINSNQMRRELAFALAALKLFSPDLDERRAAAAALKDEADESRLPVVEKALASETDASLKDQLSQIRAAVLVASPDVTRRLDAARTLAGSLTPATRSLVAERLRPAAEGGEDDPAVRSQLQIALKAIERRLAWGERLGVLFTGVSLGSILLLVALGLAITYGLMGVINMAHGELMMIGAYATYLVQNLFRTYLPGAFDAYVLVAMPVSFLAAAGVGAVMERGVIRWLYGRPLETLLATWGISLVLMQGVRSLFGAQNVSVENPAWLSGGVQVLSNLTLPYNRIAIVAFAGLLGLSLRRRSGSSCAA